jgi:hypothetical protein
VKRRSVILRRNIQNRLARNSHTKSVSNPILSSTMGCETVKQFWDFIFLKLRKIITSLNKNVNKTKI